MKIINGSWELDLGGICYRELWEEVCRVEEILGKEEFLFSLEKAMGNDMLEDLTAYICRANDIETKCKEK